MPTTKDEEQELYELERQPKDLSKQPRSFKGSRAHLRRFIAALKEPYGTSWNTWRKQHPKLRPDLRGLDLTIGDIDKTRIGDMNLRGARLSGAKLIGLYAWFANLDNADLQGADLTDADLSGSDVNGANFQSSRLWRTMLTGVNAKNADFRNADLSHANMNSVDLQGADLRGARVAGLSIWSAELDKRTKQNDLILEELPDFLEHLVDSKLRTTRIPGRANHLETAQLLYLINDKSKLKTVIDAMTENLVLLLGNFSTRKPTLEIIENQLVKLGYFPVIFDFEAPVDRDLIETAALLAGLSCFLIVDLTDPRSTPLETMLIAPQLGIPLASIIHKGQKPFSMFNDLHAKYSWVLPTWTYRGKKHLVEELDSAVVKPCEKKRKQLRRRRRLAKKAFTATSQSR